MARSGRERKFLLVTAIIIAGIFVADLIVQPYFQWRNQLKSQSLTNRLSLDEDLAVLERKQKMETVESTALTQLPAEPASAENQLLHQLHNWEHDSGVTDTSFQRMQIRDEEGFNVLSFHVTADGSMAQIARFMLCLESSTNFLRLDELHLIPKRNADDMLQLQANLSTLCKSSSAAHERIAGAQ